MDKKEKRLINLLQDVYATQESEIQCDAASTQMIQSAQRQLTDKASQQQFPELWHHFTVCSDCWHEYKMLFDMIHLEETDQLELPQTIPPLPDRNNSPRWSMQEVITRIFPGFSPNLAVNPVRSWGEQDFRPVEVTLDDQFSLELSIGIHEANAELRDLSGYVHTDDEQQEVKLEGISIWLLAGDEGPVIQEETLDDLSEFVFFGIAPGQYALRFQMAKNDFVVSAINVP